VHEDLGRTDEVDVPSDRSFGIVAACFFALAAVAPLLRDWHHPIRWWALVVAVAALSMALFWTAPLGPLNRLSFKLSRLVFRVVSPIVLGLLFFVAVAPVGLLMRACGKDPLRLRRNPGATSYWIPREPPGPSPESMRNQF
jgi:hypothetical protein